MEPQGNYVRTGGSLAQIFQSFLLGPWTAGTNIKKMGNLPYRPNRKDIILMNKHLMAGEREAHLQYVANETSRFLT
jgi:hypothetical protein